MPEREFKVFIDGEAGTTGLTLRRRLAEVREIVLESLPEATRKDPRERQRTMAKVDLVALCLPDAAAREAVALADELGPKAPKILDASSAHRVDPAWVYGFPEIAPGQAERIAKASRVSNPGCYPTGAIALLRPLVDAGLIPADQPLAISATSGYSGGGKSMIGTHETTGGPAFELYALGLAHKHVPELQRYAGLSRRPIFLPAVGHYRQGMLVAIPLHLDCLPGKPRAADLAAALVRHYEGASHVRVLPAPEGGRLEPEALNGTDVLELRVVANEAEHQAVLLARLDNLGKGAAGGAVQNILLMLGLAEPGAATAQRKGQVAYA